MPDSAKRNMEEFNGRAKAGIDINFRNRNHEEYEWENDE